jgi:hypothetical protein
MIDDALRQSLRQPDVLGRAAPVVNPKPAPAPVAAPVAPVAPVTAAPAKPAEPSFDTMSDDELYRLSAMAKGSDDREVVARGLTAADLVEQRTNKQLGLLQDKKTLEEKTKKAEIDKDFAEKQRVLTEKQQKILDSEHGHFAPSKETAKDIASIFSIMTFATMGAGTVGKYHGMNALASLTGAMKGYKEGRDDLYKKEMDSYNKSLAEFGKHQEALLKQVELSQKLLSTDKDAAMSAAQAAIAMDTGGMAALKLRQGDYKGTMTILRHRLDAIDKAKKDADALAERKREAEIRNNLAQQRINITIAGKDAKASAKGADDVSSYLSDKGIHIADKKDRAAVQSAVNAYSTLQSLKSDVASDPSLVGRQGQIRQFADKYYQSFKGEGPAVDESGVKPEDQAALRFAKKYASMLTRYEQALAGTSRSGSTVAFQKRFNALLSQDQFNPAGLSALMDDMEVEVARGAREKSHNITHGVMEDMASEFGAGLEQPISKAAPAAPPAASSSQKVDIKSYPIIGNTPDGRPVHQAPDGKKYVE